MPAHEDADVLPLPAAGATPFSAAADGIHDAEAVLRRIGDGYIVLDREFRFVYANPAAERDMRRSLTELRGRVHWEVFPTSFDGVVGRRYRAAAETGVPQHFTEHHRYEGCDVHLEMSAYPTDGGGVAVFWRDVTARVKAEQALRARGAELETSETRLRAVLDTMSEGVVVQAAGTGAIVDWNPAAERILGLTADQLAGRTSLDPRWGTITRAGDPLPGERHPAMRALTTGAPAADVFGVRTAAGDLRWVSVKAAPIRDAGTGAVTAAVATFSDVTEALETQARHALTAAGVGTWTWYPATNAVRWSEDLGPLLGRPRGWAPAAGFPEFLGMVHADDRPAMLAKLDSALQTGAPYDPKYRVRWPDGSWRWLQGAAAWAERGPDGAVRRMDGAVWDVTALEEGARALHAAEARYRALVDSLPDGVLVRVGTEIRYANPAVARLLGAPTVESLVGRSILDLVVPEERASVVARMQQAVETGTFGHAEVSLARLDDGGHVLVEVSTVPTEFSEDGTTFQAVQVTIRDITARRQADAALRASEALYRGILENVRALAMCLDADGRVTFANDAFLEATGWPREAVLGADYFARFVPHLAKAPDHYRTAMAMGMVDGIPAHYAAEVQRRDGTVRHIEWDTTVLRDADGRAVGVASVGQDVTEQRALAARLAALSENDELTGLHNRRGFRRMAEQELRSAARTERCDAVLYVDLDRFKPINDTYGHASGDEALRSVATVIQTTLRDADFGARLGGDEFAIYAVGLHPGDGDVVAARLRANLAAHNAVAAAAGRPFHLEFSVGVAERAPGEALDVLLARADASLYAQKLARKAGEHERR